MLGYIPIILYIVGVEGGFLISIPILRSEPAISNEPAIGEKLWHIVSKINKNKLNNAWILMQNFVPLLYEREIDSFDCVFDGNRPPVSFACNADCS